MLKQDGKLFGKISIIDVAAILAVVVLLVGLAIRLSGNSGVTVSSGEELECVVLVKEVRQETVEALAKRGAVFDKTSKEYIGEIVGVASEQATEMVEMENGQYKEVPVDGRYNAYVTIAFTGSVSDAGYYTASNKQISVGGSLEMNAKFSQCEGKIRQVRYAKDK